MSFSERHIVETYSGLFEGLSSSSKMELIEELTRSLKTEESVREARFSESFGAFSAEKSAEEIVAEIKSSRSFRNKDLKF
jgi:hypothetical protein